MQADWGERVLKNPHQNKKHSEKALIPLPPTGLASFFCANPDVVQIEPAAQAGRGALQGIGHCTECKVLKGNAARLHSGAAAGQERAKAETPVL